MKIRPFPVIASLLLATSAPAQPAHVRDVTPDMGIVFQAFFSEGFALFGHHGVFASSADAGFRRSQNGGEHWERAMSGYVDAVGTEQFAGGFCQSPSTPATLYSPSGLNVLVGRLFFRSDDFGDSWRQVTTPGDAVGVADCAVDPVRPEVVYAVGIDFESGTGALFKSTDGAQSWVNPGAVGLALENPSFVRVSPAEPDTLYVGNLTGEEGDGIYVSHDGGSSFARMDASPFLPFRLALHPTQPGLLFVVDSFGGFFRSSDGGNSFGQVGPVTAVVNSVALDPADPSAAYLAAGASGVYRSTDFGQTFSRLAGPTAAQLGPRGVTVIGVAPAGGRRTTVYVGTDRGPYRSHNGGDTFESIDRSYRGARVNDLAVDASGRLAVATYYTVVALRAEKARHPASGSYEAFAGQITTTQPDQFGEWDGTSIAVSPVNPGVAVVTTLLNGIFFTEDGGASWNPATISPFDPGSGPRVVVRFASATRVYYVFPGSSFGVARSDDGGRSFEQVSPGRFAGLAFDLADPEVIYLGSFDTQGGLFKSVDGGATVTSLGVSGNFWTLAIDPHTHAIYAGNHAGGVLRSADDGATWRDASTGLPPGAEVLAVAADPSIPSRAYAWVRGAGLFSTTDAGDSWIAEDTGESVRRSGIDAGRAAIAVDPLKPGRVYLGNSGVLQIDTLGDERD